MCTSAALNNRVKAAAALDVKGARTTSTVSLGPTLSLTFTLALFIPRLDALLSIQLYHSDLPLWLAVCEVIT